ncbi:MAG: EpsG family protein [Christensenellales bacterium]
MNENTINKTARVKKNRFFLFAVIFIIWLLFALNNGNIDYANYKNEYDAIGMGNGSGYFEIGFEFIMRIGGFLHMSYAVFLAVLATICVIFLYKIIGFFARNNTFVWILYLIYPFVFDVVQYRNLLAALICLYALRFIVGKDKLGVLKYVAHVLLAMTFHMSAIVYLLFLLIKIKNWKRLTVLCLIINVLMITALFTKEHLESLLTKLRLDRYVRYDISGSVSTFVQYLLVYLFFLALSLIKYRRRYNCVAFKLVLIISVYVPTILLNGTAARLFRNAFLLIYCILAAESGYVDKTTQRFINFAMFFAMLFVAWMQLGSGLYYDGVLVPVITENWLW